MKKKKGFTLIELLVVIAIIAMLLAILMPALGKVKKLAMRLVCGTNVKGMANALNVYAFDYRDEYPIAGGKGNNTWTATTPQWANYKDADWSGDDNVSVSASLFMLVREADVGVKSFICPSSDQQAFVNKIDCDVVELWDFGGPDDPDGQVPKDCQSYSYQMPYPTSKGHFPADGTSSPGNAVIGDRNPWFNPDKIDKSIPVTQADYISTVGLIGAVVGWDEECDRDLAKWEYQVGNAEEHDREGQNVLFNDGHVSFEKRPDVGTRYDNIYTTKGGGGAAGNDLQRRQGGIPDGIPNTKVKHRDDSVLVNDCY